MHWRDGHKEQRSQWRSDEAALLLQVSWDSWSFPGALQKELPGAVCIFCCRNTHHKRRTKVKTLSHFPQGWQFSLVGSQEEGLMFLLKATSFFSLLSLLLISSWEVFAFWCPTGSGVKTYLGFSHEREQDEKGTQFFLKQGASPSAQRKSVWAGNCMRVLFVLRNRVAQKDSRYNKEGAMGQNRLVDIKAVCPNLSFSVQERHRVPGASPAEGYKDH